MTLPVTLQEVKDDLRFDTDDSDSILALKLLTAEALVLNYLKINSTDDLAVGDPAVIPDRVDNAVSGAIRLMVGYLVRNPDNDTDHEWEQGYLPRPVTAMLYPLRDPALA